MAILLEKTFQAALIKAIRADGGEQFKVISANRRGVSDLVVRGHHILAPDGRIGFWELKAVRSAFPRPDWNCGNTRRKMNGSRHQYNVSDNQNDFLSRWGYGAGVVGGILVGFKPKETGMIYFAMQRAINGKYDHGMVVPKLLTPNNIDGLYVIKGGRIHEADPDVIFGEVRPYIRYDVTRRKEGAHLVKDKGDV